MFLYNKRDKQQRTQTVPRMAEILYPTSEKLLISRICGIVGSKHQGNKITNQQMANKLNI